MRSLVTDYKYLFRCRACRLTLRYSLFVLVYGYTLDASHSVYKSGCRLLFRYSVSHLDPQSDGRSTQYTAAVDRSRQDRRIRKNRSRLHASTAAN